MNNNIVLFCLAIAISGCIPKNTFRPGIPVKVSVDDFNTCFSYYNTTPESPDGTNIAYVRFLSFPENDRAEKVPAEIWVCSSDLTGHRKLIRINDIAVHNGARVQWIDDSTLACEDDSIRILNLEGETLAVMSGRIGHHPHNGRILYAAKDEESKLATIYEYDVRHKQRIVLGNALDFQEVAGIFPNVQLREVKDFGILHLQYSPDGEKIAFRLDIGPRNETYRHLVTMDHSGQNIRYFGPKPMHFAWYDNGTIMGHDNQIDDSMPNDKSGRRWDLNRKYIETLSGTGNHLGASADRMYYASESRYQKNPVVLSVFRKGDATAFWQDTVSTDTHTTWTLANHANPSFSRDGKRLYYNKCVAPGVVHTYMVILPAIDVGPVPDAERESR
jgi:hypothetical protein